MKIPIQWAQDSWILSLERLSLILWLYASFFVGDKGTIILWTYNDRDDSFIKMFLWDKIKS